MNFLNVKLFKTEKIANTNIFSNTEIYLEEGTNDRK